MVDRLANTEVNSRRISHIEACFGASSKTLLEPSRVLVGEGVLTKLCRKKPKQRQFFLFNDLLVYGNIVISKKRYNKQTVLSLKNVRVEDIPDNSPHSSRELGEGGESLQHGWLIISPTKSFAVYALTAMEKREWMQHMTRCIEEERRKAGMQGVNTEGAPAWIPDADASDCMRCKKVKFTTLQRRHHCRMCGYVVCRACSTRKSRIEHQSAKPLRVCDTCYETLVKGSNETLPMASQSAASNSQFHGNSDSSDSADDKMM